MEKSHYEQIKNNNNFNSSTRGSKRRPPMQSEFDEPKLSYCDVPQPAVSACGIAQSTNAQACDQTAYSRSQGTSDQTFKNKKDQKDAVSREDWEGGGSRPAAAFSDEMFPHNNPANDLQTQADSVPKAKYGDFGPPKNLQSLPTQNTHELAAEEELDDEVRVKAAKNSGEEVHWNERADRLKKRGEDYRGRRSA